MIILFYIALFLYIATLSMAANIVDFDLWARMIVGKTFFETGSLLNYDFLSFGPTQRWFDHEWGSSLIFYNVLDTFGDKGIIIFKTIVLFLVFFIFSKIILLRRNYKNKTSENTFKTAPLNILFFIFLIQSCLDIVFATIRCQTLTFLLFAIWFYTLEKSRLQGSYKLLWILPATMLIWSNIHGGCFTGLGLLALYIIGEFLNKKPYKPYIIAFLTSLAVMFINPYGPKYVYFLFFAITMKRPNITEWQPIFSSIHALHFIKYKLYALVISTIALVFAFKKYKKTPGNAIKEKLINFYKNLDKTKALVLIVMLLLSLKTLRLIPFFAFSAAVFLYDDIYKIFNKKLPPFLNNLKEIFLYTIILISFIYTFKTCNIQTTVSGYPYIEAEFLKINNLKGNLLADFHYGSYLAYKLWPDNHILMDGRYEETYNPGLLNRLKEIHVGENWKDALNIQHVDYIIVSKTQKLLIERLNADKSWRPALASKNFILYINSKINLENPKTPSNDLNYYNKTKWETNIDWK